jgi:2-furoyl-CoA dehydrogenase large subunit
MQHLWLTERIADIVAHQLGPTRSKYASAATRSDEMPYETPNGCVYDSGDGAAWTSRRPDRLRIDERHVIGPQAAESGSARPSTRGQTISASPSY